MDLPLPPDEDCLALASRAIAMVSARVQAALPGAVEALWTLHDEGYLLHTASGSFSVEIAGYLQGMGVRACFGRPYGADLINTFKEGPHYYAHLFANLGIRPEEAMVVDDNAEAISWAAQTGARAVLVDATSDAETASLACIERLADLPGFLQQLR